MSPHFSTSYELVNACRHIHTHYTRSNSQPYKMNETFPLAKEVARLKQQVPDLDEFFKTGSELERKAAENPRDEQIQSDLIAHTHEMEDFLVGPRPL